jgi:2'-5' RNA ligase
MRIFLAIMLSSEVRRELTRAQRIIAKSHGDGLRFTENEALHLTLKFLGEIDDPRIPEIERTADEICGSVARFSLTAQAAGVFPPAGRINIVWAGFSCPPELAQCAVMCEERFEALGFRREGRAYTPHVTIARVKTRPASGLRELIAGLTIEPVTENVTEIALVQSTPTPQGSRYTVVHRSALR